MFNFAFLSNLPHEGIDHRCRGVQHGASRRGLVLRRGAGQDAVRKAQLHRFVRVHPGFAVHEVGQLGTTEAGLDLVGIDDGIFHALQHGDGLLHLAGIAPGDGGRVVDHHGGHRGHQHLGSCHGDDRGGAGGDAVNFHGHIMGIVHKHIVDLRRRHAVPAGTVDPDGDVAGATHQLVLEKLRSHIIVIPAILGDGAVEEQRPFLRGRLRCRLHFPVPEFFHRNPPLLS